MPFMEINLLNHSRSGTLFQTLLVTIII